MNLLDILWTAAVLKTLSEDFLIAMVRKCQDRVVGSWNLIPFLSKTVANLPSATVCNKEK